MNRETFSDVRPSPIAGSWYPGNPSRLRSNIQEYLNEAAPPAIQGQVLALVVPHAGYIYSGLTAAHAFKYVDGADFSRIILLSPSHQYYPDPLLTSAHQAYGTPLGEVPVDRSALQAIETHLSESSGYSITPVRRDREHSLEIELPFLQVVLPSGFTLVPLMLVEQSRHLTSALAQAITRFISDPVTNGRTLLIASSDLSHFYTEKQANRLDGQVLSALQNMDVSALYKLNASGAGQACGLGPIATVLLAAQELGANQLTIADYRTSAAVTHDSSSVVGYGSAVLTKPA